MSTRLSIGDFSRMTFLSVKTLRHYHEVGLLAPAEIDAHSGYRYYTPDQVGSAQLIRRLRDLDLPVPQVREVLAAPDASTRDAVIAEHLDRMTRTARADPGDGGVAAAAARGRRPLARGDGGGRARCVCLRGAGGRRRR